jgi:hypothetical protein
MKIEVDIITGFLGSGKTKLINSMFQNERLLEDAVVILQCEIGETEIKDNLLQNKNIYVKNINKEISLDSKYIDEIIKEYKPRRIIIEANGMDKLQNLLNTFDDSIIRANCVINKVIHTIDGLTFDIFMNNMGGILAEQISNSNYIVLNNVDAFTEEKLKKVKRTLKGINKSAKIVTAVLGDDERVVVDDEVLSMEKKSSKLSSGSDKLLIPFSILIFAYLLFSAVKPSGFDMSVILTWLQGFNTIFLGILIQALPFILFGVFVSSIIQVFISSETITKIFPKESKLGYIVAIFAGLFFPVCDCAIVPVGARLVKKGVSLPIAITFMLAAPIVNPIVIASTLYAFPGQYYITLYRIYFGVVVAILVGSIFEIFPEKKSMLLNNMDNFTCNCGFCSDNDNNSNGILGKIDVIFKHATAEFFEVGKFLIIGAFLSSIIQTMVSKNVLANLGGGNVVSLLIMMILAFGLSVCSTSDAFIARTFVNQFPMGAVMGFMVLGPMVDIKNLLMLLGSFEKKFVIKLVSLIFCISFVILLFSTILLQLR